MLLGACSGPNDADQGQGESPSPTETPSPSPTETSESATPTVSPTPTPTEEPSPTEPPEFDAANALGIVERLAGEIGPRETTSDAFREAADYVERRFTRFGYDVERQSVDVPAGNSWGVDVPAGTADNLVATNGPVALDEPHLVVGAHLDTVPQSPGAEDNASGVAAVLELARMAAAAPPPLPVVFIVFAAEEPRGEGDDWHHFGSQAYVAELSDAQRSAIQGMLSLDRIGAGSGVRIRSGGQGPDDVVRGLRAAAGRLDIEASGGASTASDHWSFEKADVPAGRLGGNAYAGYHNADDTIEQLRESTLDANGRIAWNWLSSFG